MGGPHGSENPNAASAFPYFFIFFSSKIFTAITIIRRGNGQEKWPQWATIFYYSEDPVFNKGIESVLGSEWLQTSVHKTIFTYCHFWKHNACNECSLNYQCFCWKEKVKKGYTPRISLHVVYANYELRRDLKKQRTSTHFSMRKKVTLYTWKISQLFTIRAIVQYIAINIYCTATISYWTIRPWPSFSANGRSADGQSLHHFCWVTKVTGRCCMP